MTYIFEIRVYEFVIHIILFTETERSSLLKIKYLLRLKHCLDGSKNNALNRSNRHTNYNYYKLVDINTQKLQLRSSQKARL